MGGVLHIQYVGWIENVIVPGKRVGMPHGYLPYRVPKSSSVVLLILYSGEPIYSQISLITRRSHALIWTSHIVCQVPIQSCSNVGKEEAKPIDHDRVTAFLRHEINGKSICVLRPGHDFSPHTVITLRCLT